MTIAIELQKTDRRGPKRRDAPLASLAEDIHGFLREVEPAEARVRGLLRSSAGVVEEG